MDVNTLEIIRALKLCSYRCDVNENWTMYYIDTSVADFTGYRAEQILGDKEISFGELIHPEDSEWVSEYVKEALAIKSAYSVEYRIIKKGGDIVWLWERGHLCRRDGKDVLEGLLVDISDEKQVLEAKRLRQKQQAIEADRNLNLLSEYKRAVDASAIVAKTDPQGVITYVNDELCRVTGYQRHELIGQSYQIFRAEGRDASAYALVKLVVEGERSWHGVLKNYKKDKTPFYVRASTMALQGVDGSVIEVISIQQEITDLIKQKEIIRQHTTDPLTQLPNRLKLLESLKENKRILAVLNIDKFKEVNEYYGFDVGDRLLVELSRKIQQLLNQEAYALYKLTADEFAILSKKECDEDLYIDEIKRLIKIIQAHTFLCKGQALKIHLVAGISAQQNRLINAEMAMNHGKTSGHEVTFFDKNLAIRDQLVDNINWTKKLREGLQNDQVIVYAQAIFSNPTKEVSHYECLVRFEEQGKPISPIHFLDTAKRAKIYAEITRTVIRKSVAFFASRTETFSINLSIEDINNPETMAYLEQQLQLNPSIGPRLVIEVVEQEGIENHEDMDKFVERIKSYGSKIAIDDFGTGYSNFEYLMKLNVDYIKIDGSIIKNIHNDNNARLVVELIISFAGRLGMMTVAEFVHSKEVFDTVTEMGINYSQGFHLAQPAPFQFIDMT